MTTATKKNPQPELELEVLTAQWARAKVMEDTGKIEAKRKRTQILEDPRAVPGYADDSLVINETTLLDLEDKRLERVLKAEGVFDQALEDPKLSTSKVRALAETNPKIAKVLELIGVPSVRFEQAAKKG